MTSNQIGKFYLASMFVRDVPDYAKEVFRIMGCVPVRVAHVFERDAYEYVALSERFKSIRRGEVVPEYTIFSAMDENGKITSVDVKMV